MDLFILVLAGGCFLAFAGSVKRTGPTFRYTPAEYRWGWGGTLLGVAAIALVVRWSMS